MGNSILDKKYMVKITKSLKSSLHLVDEVLYARRQLPYLVKEKYMSYFETLHALAEKRIKMNDIRGIFTENEWKGLANSLNGTIVDDIMRYSPDMLIAHCDDAELYESAFSAMGASVKTANEKIKGLTKIQVSSVLDRVAEFWNNQNGTGIELDKWAKW